METNKKQPVIKKEVFFDPADSKEKAPKKVKTSIWNKFSKNMKKWFFGVGKELSRVTWITKGKILEDFIIVLVIALFFALLFFGIDMLLISL